MLWKLGADQSLQSCTWKRIIKIAGDSECTLLEIVYINRAGEIRFRTRPEVLPWLSDEDGEELSEQNTHLCSWSYKSILREEGTQQEEEM